MPISTTIPIEEDGQVDFTIAVKQIVDHVLTHQKGSFEEGLQRINIKRTVNQIWQIMKDELPKNPMLELDVDDPKVREICRITLKNILINYGVSESHLRRVFPQPLKLLSHVNLRYRASLPYFDSSRNVMVPSNRIKKEV